MAKMRFATAVILLSSLCAPTVAQDLTDDQLLQMFQTQRDAFKAANAGGGKTRGLVLVPVNDVDTVTGTEAVAATEAAPPEANVAATAAAPVESTGVVVAGATEQPVAQPTATIAETTPQPVVFGTLDKELQVNVNIKFGFDSATLTGDQKPQLVQMCNVMKSSDIKLFRIVGHTDAAGTTEYNQKLSQLRAEEVQRYLVRDCGIAPTRLEALGLGEQFLSDETDPKGPDNRRVEFQALS